MSALTTVYILVTVCVAHFSHASRISLKATPAFINPGITPILTIRCTVNSTSRQQPVVGRREVADIIHPQLRRQTEADIVHITSIVVTRQDHVTGINQTVASVTTFDSAKAHTDIGKLNVSGTTASTTPGEQGYLQLTWSNPTGHQYGIYSCEVFALNGQDHSEEIIQAVQVGINEPSTLELLLYIADLENRTTNLENRLGRIQGGNVQTDTVPCIQGTHDYFIAFVNPFDKLPTVITAVAGAQNSEAFVSSPAVLNLTPAGFTLRCTSYQQTTVVWVAL